MKYWHFRVRLAIVIGVLSAFALTPAYAHHKADHARPHDCTSGGSAPECQAPEVPAAAIYPALAAGTFLIGQALRARRRGDRDEN